MPPPAKPKPEIGEKNTFRLPRGEMLRRAMVAVFREQRTAILHYLNTGRKLAKKDQEGGPPALPVAWPDWHDFGLGALELSERMTPLLRLTWEAAADRFAPRVGLDPDSWSVVNPHTERMIEEAALNFCASTNATTSKTLDVALAETRKALVEGVVKEGEALEKLTKRIMAIFESATKSKARQIAQTETSRAVHAAQEQAAIASGVVTGWEWLLSADACPKCVAIYVRAPFVRLNHAFAVVGNNPHYSTVKFPPLHPHCDCSLNEVLDTDPQPAWSDTLHQPKPATAEEHDQAAVRQTELIDSIFPGAKPKPPRPTPAPPRKPKPLPPDPAMFELPVRNPSGPTPGEPVTEEPPPKKPKKPKPKPAPKPRPVKPRKPPEFPAADNLVVIRKLGGSTGAELVEDEWGRQWVRKSGANPGHLREEDAADRLYRAMGVNVPKSKVFELPTGPVKLSEFHEGQTLGSLRHADPAAYEAAKVELRKHFAVDCLLGNWDVIGASADNVLVMDPGKVLRIDNGGSLRYRAQGALKSSSQWTGTVGELATMQNPSMNPAAAEIFVGMTADEIKAQAKAIWRRKAAILAAAPADLKGTLEQRIDYLHDYGKPAAPVKVGKWKATPAGQFKTFATTHEGDEWGKANYQKWADGLTKEEKQAIQEYKNSDYVAINRHHRDPGRWPETPEIKRQTALIDKALGWHPVPESVTTIRYFSLSDVGLTYDKVKLGSDIMDTGYVSTSLNPDHTWSGHRFEVRVPRGTEAGYVKLATPTHQSEYELLLGRKADRFRVVELKADAHKTIVVEIVAEKPKKAKVLK